MQVEAIAHGEVVGLPATLAKAVHGLGFHSWQLRSQIIGNRQSFLAQLTQRHRQLHRFNPFVGAQVAIARTQRQTVWGAASVYTDDVNRQGKLAHHVANHHQLLVVLLAKHRHTMCMTREHGHEELHHHRAHTGEKAWAKLPLQDVSQSGVG